VDAYVPPGDWTRLRYWIHELLERPPIERDMQSVSSETVGKYLREAYGKLVAVGV